MTEPKVYSRFYPALVTCPIRNEAPVVWFDVIPGSDKFKIQMHLNKDSEHKEEEKFEVELTEQGFDYLIRILKEVELTSDDEFIEVQVKAPDTVAAPYTRFVVECSENSWGGSVFSLEECSEDSIPFMKIQFRAGKKNRKKLAQFFSIMRATKG